LNKRQWILGLVVLAALAALALWARSRVHFDFHVLAAQVAQADWRRIAVAVACIYLAYVFRAVRWARLMRHNLKVPLFSLVGTQIIGFTTVALIGRVADPVRPFLVSKKTGADLGSQIAVYIVERLLDAGSMALIFSVSMLSVPGEEILSATKSGAMAHLAPHNGGLAIFFARYGGLILTLLGALFLFVIRQAGGAVATFFERSLGLISKNLGHAVGHKIRTFHAGLDTIRSAGDFFAVTGLSLAMWLTIALAYYMTCSAFVASPELAAITPSKTVLLMVASGTASIIQLPIIGWFSQIGLVAVAIGGVLHAQAEAATACSAMLLLATFLCVVPTGLIWAQFEHISLRKVAVESEQVEEEIAAEDSNSAVAP
jgi:hypothetical protein